MMEGRRLQVLAYRYSSVHDLRKLPFCNGIHVQTMLYNSCNLLDHFLQVQRMLSNFLQIQRMFYKFRQFSTSTANRLDTFLELQKICLQVQILLSNVLQSQVMLYKFRERYRMVYKCRECSPISYKLKES